MGSVNDEVFGLMEYKHRWIKNEIITFFGKNTNVIISAKAYKEKPITVAQREAYKKFKSELAVLSDKAKSEVFNYFSTVEKKQISSETELNSILSLKTVVFNPNGDTILLFDSTLDEENGIGIQLYPVIQVGPQDIFL